MIIEAEIGGHCIHRMYVDGESASDILYEHCFNRLRPEIKNQLVPATTPLIGFTGEIIWPIGQIQLLTRSQKIISSRLVLLECALVSGPEETLPATKPTVKERVKVAINPEYLEQTVMIGSTLTEEGRNKLCGLLQRNLDIFAWKPTDMTGVPRHIAEHRLNVWEGCSPVRQKKRGQAADRNQAIQEEVGKLVEAGIMKEEHYHDWLSNLVMVKKHDDSWRMCVDFKDLNKACPKNGYPLPKIDWKVESICEFPFKCFLDAYKGYYQIKVAKEDEEKTAFITSQGIFCYTKLPFGLRNAGATYQHLVYKAFHKQIGRNLEVYVDDLVIKSHTEDEIVRDIEETFKTLREINIKLNPKKCTFGVKEGMFLGYKVNTKGLKVCLDKKSDFHWTTEAEEAFKQMKQLIAQLPMLTAPMEKEELIVYFAAAKEMVSAVLMTEKEAKQMPIYFVSRALREEDSSDTLMEVEEELPEPWILFTDGSSCTDGSEAGLILTTPEGMKFTYALRFSNRRRGRYMDDSHFKIPYGGNPASERETSKSSTRFVMDKALRIGYYWPTMHKDARSLIRACQDCQVHKPVPRNPQQKLTPTTSPWPLVERANRSLGEEIKARLDARSKNWMEELPHILWVHSTMTKSSNGDTPFSLTYGTEAVIPAEIGMPTLRTTEVDLVLNDEALEINLDLLEEKREQAEIREAK
ncbi:reverse transcriptase domain-containing protein [Tanacetum coccineum]